MKLIDLIIDNFKKFRFINPSCFQIVSDFQAEKYIATQIISSKYISVIQCACDMEGTFVRSLVIFLERYFVYDNVHFTSDLFRIWFPTRIFGPETFSTHDGCTNERPFCIAGQVRPSFIYQSNDRPICLCQMFGELKNYFFRLRHLPFSCAFLWISIFE